MLFRVDRGVAVNHPAPVHPSDQARTRPQRPSGAGVRVPVGDIHDIRMLTATGPIELPAAPGGEQGRREA